MQLLPALDAVKGVVTNGLLRDAIEKSREEIREGHGMGQTLAQSGLFPPLLIEMIRVGERSGELESDARTGGRQLRARGLTLAQPDDHDPRTGDDLGDGG